MADGHSIGPFAASAARRRGPCLRIVAVRARTMDRPPVTCRTAACVGSAAAALPRAPP